MTTQDIVTRVKDRTRHRDDTRVVGEINSAKDWAYTKIFLSENGPDLLMTHDTELTMSAQTRSYDLDANITGTLYGIKKLWLRFSNETNFTEMKPVDSSDEQFSWDDRYPASDTTTVASGHPVRYDIVNFAKVRFAPPLPTNAVIRVDAWIKPPDIDPTLNPTLTYSADIPEPSHEAIVDKATAQIFNLLDDDRWEIWEASAARRLSDALYLMTKRQQGPVETKPFRKIYRRWA